MQNVTTGESFYTFCLEQSVYMYGGGQYQVTNISNKVISGGTGQTAVFLDGGTKWLFYQWATGTLSGYIQGDPTSKGEGALQLAIWQLQGQSFGLLQGDYSGVDFYNAAVNHRSEGNLLPVFAANPVLLGTDKEGQSFLIVQTPEPMTLILLGAGLLGLAGLRRKE